MAQKHILVVDDDPNIRDVICYALEKADMQVTLAEDGAQALNYFNSNDKSTYDLLVLDINMPEMDGLELCRTLRKTSEIPILFLSSRDDEIDRIIGLELGGDDYVTKPFSPRELIARINAILKRLQNNTSESAQIDNTDTFTCGSLVMNTEQHEVHWKDQPISLTATEFAILQRFMLSPMKVFSRDAIMEGAYQYNIHVSDRTIDSHIRHIRAKFNAAGCESIIETLHGVGYKLSKTV